MDMDIVGQAELGRAFAAFPKKLANKHIKRSIREIMKTVVLAQAKEKMAKDSGLLRKALTVRAAKGRGGRRLRRTEMGSAVVIKDTVDYAKYVEFDRKLRDGTIRKGDRTLRESLYDNAMDIRFKLESSLRKALAQVAAETRTK